MKKLKLIILLLPVLLLLSGSSNPPVNVRVNVDATSITGKLEPFWASQIIHPTEFMLTEWGENLLSLFSESGAARQYIRLYNQPERAI